MRRREFLGLVAMVAAWPLVARGQQHKVYRIGIFNPGSASMVIARADSAFLEALRQLGWVEGKNVAFEYRYADNRLEQLAELAGELVRLNVDVIVAMGTLAPLAAKQATSTIPIVMAAAGDQIGTTWRECHRTESHGAGTWGQAVANAEGGAPPAFPSCCTLERS